MKNLIYIACILLMVSCKKEQPPKDYLVLHGTITNPIDSLKLRLFNPENSKNILIDVDVNGNFRDTLRLDAPATFNVVYDGIFALYLYNDMDLNITLNTKNFAETIRFSGKGEAENSFIKFKSNASNALYGEDYKVYYSLNQIDFDAKTNDYVQRLESELNSKKALLDSSFVRNQKESLKTFLEQNLVQYTEQQKINQALAQGNPSPEFNKYINYAGGTSSLKDFKGKYVYIDVWATWCGPCKYEIPFLEKIEKQYQGKNITFISLSIDNLKDEQKWRTMIKDKNMSGIQLLADKDYDSQFIRDYFIYGIPRFILLDPNGNIVNYDAPRPSEEKLISLFTSLNI